MSYQLETLNKGEIANFGFLGPDVTKVRLGELPSLRFDDFCKYATNVLVIASESAPDSDRGRITQLVERAIEESAHLPVRDNMPTSFHEESIDIFKESLSNMAEDHELRNAFVAIVKGLEDLDDEAEDLLDSNPFNLHGSTVNIGENYQLSLLEFAYFTTYAMGGGWFGWDKRGIPKSASEGLHKIRESLKLLAVA